MYHMYLQMDFWGPFKQMYKETVEIIALLFFSISIIESSSSQIARMCFYGNQELMTKHFDEAELVFYTILGLQQIEIVKEMQI